jgi:hypothetical protein
VPRRTPRPATPLVALALVAVLVAASITLVLRLTGNDSGGGTRADPGAPSASPSPADPSTPSTAGPDAAGPDGGTPSTTAGAGAVSSSDLSPGQARTIETLKAQVSQIRGLPWKSDLPIRIVSPGELARRVAELTAADREKHPGADAASEAALKLLGLIPRDLDFSAAVDKLLAGGVLGFYDDEAKELFVGGDPGAELDVATKSTMVHELTHALTDQTFDFGARNRTLSDQELSEEAFALSALVEGDAELVRILWSDQHLTSRQQLEAELGSGGGDPSVYAETPAYILDDLFFPYTTGLDFVTSLHDQGGFAAVDTAYRQPPTSTEEIIHPDLYVPGRQWTRPPLPDLAGATGCTAVDTSTLGEFDMSETLDQHLPTADAETAAAGWNGDAYGLVRCGTAVGLADRWRGDTPGDLAELADALGRWARDWSGSNRAPGADGRFSGPSGSGRIVRSADRLDLVIADDASTSDRLAAVLAAA